MVRDASSAPTIEDFARDTGIVAETGEDLTAGVPSGSVSQMGVQKENAAGGVFEGQAAQSENATGVESDEAIEMRRVVEDTGMPQATADAMVETYRPVEGMTAREYAAAFAEAEMYGRRGVSEAALARNEQIAKLPVDVARAAYGLGVKAGQTASVAKEKASVGAGAGVRYSRETSNVVEIQADEELARKVNGAQSSTEKHNAIRQYLIDKCEGQTFRMSDGKTAIMDRSDAQHLAQKTTRERIAEVSNVREIVEQAKITGPEVSAEHRKFNAFSYYAVTVVVEEDPYDILINVGKAKNDGTYHIYDFTKDNRKGRTAGQASPGLSRVTKTGVIRNGSPTPIVAQTPPVVNKKNTEISRPSLRPGRVLRAEGVNVQKFSDAQYATYKAAEIMARALGTDIVIHESLGKTKDGKVINGYFDPKDGRIHVNINAMRDGSHIGLYVLSHEVTHAIKEWSPRKYAELERFVMERLGADAEVKIEAKLKQMRDAGLISETATEAEAYALAKEEVVAEGMEDVLSDGKVLEALAKQNRTLWQKIKDVVTAAIGKIKAAFGDLNKHSKTAKVLTDTVESLESIEQLFYEGVVDAGEARRSGADGAVTRTNAGKMQVSDDANYSYKELVKNDPLPFVEFSEAVPLADDGKTMDRDFVVGEARKNARSYNNSRNTETATYVYVPSIGKDVLIGKRALDHGLSHGANDTALATMKIGDLLQNSIAVNELDGRTTKKKTTDMSYVLLAVGKNKADSYVVRMVVDKTTDEVTEISTFGLYSVRTKKGELFSPNGDEAVASKSSSPYLLSTISIADLLEKVKGIPIINEIFSEDVAQKLGVARSQGDLSAKLRYSIESGDPGVDADVNENEAGEASPSPTDVETEVQNEAVARVEKEVQRAREQRDRAVRRQR